jgi:hypothetical protein
MDDGSGGSTAVKAGARIAHRPSLRRHTPYSPARASACRSQQSCTRGPHRLVKRDTFPSAFVVPSWVCRRTRSSDAGYEPSPSPISSRYFGELAAGKRRGNFGSSSTLQRLGELRRDAALEQQRFSEQVISGEGACSMPINQKAKSRRVLHPPDLVAEVERITSPRLGLADRCRDRRVAQSVELFANG